VKTRAASRKTTTGVRRAKTKPKDGVRAQRLEQTRRDLLRAATAVIGEVGYEKASIARITSRAKVAQGTFYTYFKSRQDLFDRLLPAVGEDMLGRLAERMHGATNLMDVEERGLRGLFQYLGENPGFYRLLNEAETLAPKAHRAHFKNVTKGYIHALRVAWEKGELSGYKEDEIDVLAYMLMGMRSYLILGFARQGRTMKRLPEAVMQTYLKFVRAGFKAT
jgi:AcrR family transcriptional regulator